VSDRFWVAVALVEMAQKYDPVEAAHLVLNVREMVWRLAKMASDTRPSMIKTLLALEEHGLALAELEAMDEKDLTDELRRFRGTTRSLCRDQGAVGWYRAALDSDSLPDDEQFRCLGSTTELHARSSMTMWRPPARS
jgi:hypothetical protein